MWLSKLACKQNNKLGKIGWDGEDEGIILAKIGVTVWELGMVKFVCGKRIKKYLIILSQGFEMKKTHKKL